MSQPARSEEDLATFKSSHPACSIAQSFAYCGSCQNLRFDGKDKLAGGTFIKDSDHCTFAPAVTCALTPVLAPVVALFVASGSVDSFVVRYLEDNPQRIVKTIFEARSLLFPAFAPIPASVVAAALHYKGPRERFLKAWFPDIYWSKTHLKCYNFFQKCKYHFAIAGATGLNQVFFAATFLKDTALFRWQ